MKRSPLVRPDVQGDGGAPLIDRIQQAVGMVAVTWLKVWKLQARESKITKPLACMTKLKWDLEGGHVKNLSQ